MINVKNMIYRLILFLLCKVTNNSESFNNLSANMCPMMLRISKITVKKLLGNFRNRATYSRIIKFRIIQQPEFVLVQQQELLA